jgi:hypothetical protein
LCPVKIGDNDEQGGGFYPRKKFWPTSAKNPQVAGKNQENPYNQPTSRYNSNFSVGRFPFKDTWPPTFLITESIRFFLGLALVVYPSTNAS